MDTWNATTYSQFIDLRTRPAHDLLSVIPDHFQPKIVYDLGCGPGNSTILLKQRWPQAKITGIDSSDDMLKRAHERYPELTFVHASIEKFTPTEKIDFLFANASLQWLDKHDQLLPKLFTYISTGGAIAIQMPNNFHSPTHQVIVQQLQTVPAWHRYLSTLRYGVLKEPFYKPSAYYEIFFRAKMQNIQLWETEYLQEMENYQSIFDWLKGTGLSPVLSQMDEITQQKFSKAYCHAIAKEYPLQSNHRILLPYRRLFIMGFNAV